MASRCSRRPSRACVGLKFKALGGARQAARVARCNDAWCRQDTRRGVISRLWPQHTDLRMLPCSTQVLGFTRQLTQETLPLVAGAVLTVLEAVGMETWR